MSLEETLQKDIVTAMKAKDQLKLTALRMVKTAITNHKIQKGKEELPDLEIQEIIQKQVKQRKESLDSFEKAGRNDLAEKEKKEMEILAVYLPEQLGEDEIRSIVAKAIEISGAQSAADMGKVMKEVMPHVKGKADGKVVNGIVQQLLSKGK